MQQDLENGQLPDYADPPIVETVLGLQFDPLADCTNGHLGAFWTSLNREDWPTVADAPNLEPQFERFTDSGRWVPDLRVRLSQDPASRLQIRNRNNDRMIQVQNGRFHFNWLGQTGSIYPRFEQVRDEFELYLRKFIDFVDQEKIGDFRPNQWEVTYVNHIPKGTVWNSPSDWSFFRLLGQVPTADPFVQAESFTGEWHFQIPPELGRLHIAWQHAKSKIPDQQDEELIRLTLTARGPTQESEDRLQSIIEGVRLGRDSIVRTFKELMSDDANQRWGLKP